MPKEPIKISALLITFNEEEHILDVIKTVSFADEIIVVDAHSTDHTISLLKSFEKVTVISRPFKNFADQRNFAISQATHDWILFIDADERIPAPLRNEIIATTTMKSDVVAYMVKRRFFFGKKPIKYSGLQTDTTYRLFKKGFAQYDTEKIVHEYPLVNGKSAILKHHMLHYCYTSNADYKNKMEHYASLKAREMHKKGKKATCWHFTVRPAYKFLVNYVFRLGFLDGKEGFSICYLSAYGVWYRYRVLQKLNALPKL